MTTAAGLATAFFATLERGLRHLGGLLLAALLVPVAIQVFARLVPSVQAPLWTEEAARYLLVWTIMAGSLLAVRRGSHFCVDLLPQLPPAGERALVRVAAAVTGAFGLFCLAYGIDFVAYGWEQTSEVSDWPMWIVFSAWPVAGAAWALFSLEALVTGRQPRAAEAGV